MKKPKVIAIVGPTASGKTSLSIDIAKEFTGEVISADSRQVYRGMDIGTGKVTTDDMQEVLHHLIDIVDPLTVYTGADFVTDATKAIIDITTRNHVPIIAGGTFFYIELLRGTMQAAPVPPNEAFRKSLEPYSDQELFLQLQAQAPQRAATIDACNRRRLIRALEIQHVLGTIPPSMPTESPYDWLILGIDIPKEQLHKNIHLRLHERLQAGMVMEVESLIKNGVSVTRLDSLGLEYRYITRYLTGILTYDEMAIELETKIKQFAKRQMTWLKKDKTIEWFMPEQREVIFQRIENFLQT